ncbi:MAG: type II secretion system F family protein [Planctomycetales bacterium]|nr:type II secretion system F family protein [Planctomycetales bacterium]
MSSSHSNSQSSGHDVTVTPPPVGARSPDKPAEAVFTRHIAGRISVRHLSQLLSRVGTSYHAGVDLLKIWEYECRRGRTRHRQHMQTVHDSIRAGHSMHEAMERCGGYFPKLTRVLVKVGERSGRIDEVLLRLADHYDHVLRMRREFLQAITWPAIQLGMAITVVGLLIWIMGELLPGKVDILGWGLMGTAGLFTYLFFVSTTVAGLALGVVGLLRGWFGPMPLQIVMRVWGIGGVLRDFALARLSWCLASALEAGVDARESMRLSLEATGNAFYTQHTSSVDRVLEKGGEFHEALRQTHAFPDEFLDSLESAELSGTHSTSMLRLSKEYEERARMSSSILTKVATYATWFMIAGLIISVIFRLAFFYLNTINSALEGF